MDVFFRFFLKEFKWVFKNVHFVPNNTGSPARPLGCWIVVFGGLQKLASVNALVCALHYEVALMTKLKAYNSNSLDNLERIQNAWNKMLNLV